MKRRLATPELAMESLKRRFQKRLKPAANGCIEWTGSKTRGYGYVSVWTGDSGTPMRAHRVAFCLARGINPAEFTGGVVMHTCDNPACVNPEHLRLGEQSDNMADKKAKSRQRRGEDVPSAKLSVSEVLAIRADTRVAKVIGPEYGISHRTVRDIRARRIWKHVA